MTVPMAESQRLGRNAPAQQTPPAREERAGPRHKLRAVRTLVILVFAFAPLILEVILLLPAVTVLLDAGRSWIYVRKDLNPHLLDSIVLQLPGSDVSFAWERWYSSRVYRQFLARGGLLDEEASSTAPYVANAGNASAWVQMLSTVSTPQASLLKVFPLGMDATVRAACSDFLGTARSAASVQDAGFPFSKAVTRRESNLDATLRKRPTQDEVPLKLTRASEFRPAAAIGDSSLADTEASTRDSKVTIPAADSTGSTATAGEGDTIRSIAVDPTLATKNLAKAANSLEGPSQRVDAGKRQEFASVFRGEVRREKPWTTDTQPSEGPNPLLLWLDRDTYDVSPSRALIFSSTCVLLLRWLVLAVRAFLETVVMGNEEQVLHAGVPDFLSCFRFALLASCFSIWSVAFCIFPWMLPANESCAEGNLPGTSVPVTSICEYYQWSLWAALACSTGLFGLARFLGRRSVRTSAAVSDALPLALVGASSPLLTSTMQARHLSNTYEVLQPRLAGFCVVEIPRQQGQPHGHAHDYQERCTQRRNEDLEQQRLPQSDQRPASYGCREDFRTGEELAESARRARQPNWNPEDIPAAAQASSSSSSTSAVCSLADWAVEANFDDAVATVQRGAAAASVATTPAEASTTVQTAATAPAAGTTASRAAATEERGAPGRPGAAPAIPLQAAHQRWAVLLRWATRRWTGGPSELLQRRTHLRTLVVSHLMAKQICGAAALLVFAHTFSGSLLVLLSTNHRRTRILWMNGVCLLLEITVRYLIAKAEVRLRDSRGDTVRRRLLNSVVQREASDTPIVSVLSSRRFEEGFSLDTTHDCYTLKQLSSTYFRVLNRFAAAEGAEVFPTAVSPCFCTCRPYPVSGQERGRTFSNQKQVTLHPERPQSHAGRESERVLKPAPDRLSAGTVNESAVACSLSSRTSSQISTPDTSGNNPAREMSGTYASVRVSDTVLKGRICSNTTGTNSRGSCESRSRGDPSGVSRGASRSSTGTRILSRSPRKQQTIGLATDTCSAATEEQISNVKHVELATDSTATRSSATNESTRSNPEKMGELQTPGSILEERAGERSRCYEPETTEEENEEALSSRALAVIDEGDGETDVPSRVFLKELNCTHKKTGPCRFPARDSGRWLRSKMGTRTPQQQQQLPTGGCLQAEHERTFENFIERSPGTAEEDSPSKPQEEQLLSCVQTTRSSLPVCSLLLGAERYCRTDSVVAEARGTALVNQSLVSEKLRRANRSQQREEAPRTETAQKDQPTQPLQEQRQQHGQQEQGKHAQEHQYQAQLWQYQGVELQWERKQRQLQRVRPCQPCDQEKQEKPEGEQQQRQRQHPRRPHIWDNVQRYQRVTECERLPNALEPQNNEEERLREMCPGSGTAVAASCVSQPVRRVLNSLEGNTRSLDRCIRPFAWEERQREGCGAVNSAAETTQEQPSGAARLAQQATATNPWESRVSRATPVCKGTRGGAAAATGSYNRTVSTARKADAEMHPLREVTAAAPSPPATRAQSAAVTKNADESRAACTAAGHHSTFGAGSFTSVNPDALESSSGHPPALYGTAPPVEAPPARTTDQEGVYSAGSETSKVHEFLPPCGLCTEAKADLILLPCGHGGLCQRCAARMVEKHRERVDREGWRWNWLLRRPRIGGAANHFGETARESAARDAVSTTSTQRQQLLLPRCPLCRRQVERLLKIDSICRCRADSDNTSNCSSTATRERIVTAHTVAVLLREELGSRVDTGVRW